MLKASPKKASQLARYAAYEKALSDAHYAAAVAQDGMVENMNAFDCGFAWVVVHDLAFARWCRATAATKDAAARRHYGSKHYQSGWCFWKPGAFNGQSVGIHEAGARAFRDNIAQSLQVRAEMGSRLD